MNYVTKLGLGTVQWGLNYGIANSSGKPLLNEVSGMLEFAAASGMGLLDTAAAYGDAEQVLGKSTRISQFAIVTKTVVRADMPVVESARAGFSRSLGLLGRECVYGLLVHDANQLNGGSSEELWEFLSERKSAGEVEKIGVSVYTPDQLERLLDFFPIDLVQLPFSAYDRRFETSGLLDRLRGLGVEVHARSALLQGLMLMQPEALPKHFESIRTHHTGFFARCNAEGWSPLVAALGFCLAHPLLDRVIVGCESMGQLTEILDAAKSTSPDMLKKLSECAINDQDIVLPTNWPKN